MGIAESESSFSSESNFTSSKAIKSLQACISGASLHHHRASRLYDDVGKMVG